MKNLLAILLLSSLATGISAIENPAGVDRTEKSAVEQNYSINLKAAMLSRNISSEENKNSSLADESPSIKAKFGSGLTITTANESFRFQIRGRFQSLFLVEHMYQSDDSPLVGFQVRRARLKLAGYVGKGKTTSEDVIASKHRLKYSVQLGFTNKDISGIADGKGIILDAFIDYAPCKHLTFRFGQTKLPGGREGVTSSQKQQFVDRSLASTFRLDRDIGLQLRGKFGNEFIFKPYVSVALGEGRNQTGFNAGGLDYTFRTDFLPLGDFKKGSGDYSLGDTDREPKPKLAIGAAYDFNNNAGLSAGQRGGNKIDADSLNNIHTVFADILFKYKGLSIFSEFSHRTVEEGYRKDSDFPGKENFYNTGNGIVASIGYNCKKNFEIAARYSREMPLGNKDLDKDMKSGINAYTLGLSKYFFGHNLKIQTDYTVFETISDNDFYGVWRFQVEVAF